MQAELKDKTNAEKVVDYFSILIFDSFALKVGELLGIDTEWMCQYFCKPKLKVGLTFNSLFSSQFQVGTEWVEKGNTCENAANSVAGIARAVYERTFRICAEKCNETLNGTPLTRSSSLAAKIFQIQR